MKLNFEIPSNDIYQVIKCTKNVYTNIHKNFHTHIHSKIYLLKLLFTSNKGYGGGQVLGGNGGQFTLTIPLSCTTWAICTGHLVRVSTCTLGHIEAFLFASACSTPGSSSKVSCCHSQTFPVQRTDHPLSAGASEFCLVNKDSFIGP